jgi:magnesium-protoporphyrin O-methyltransferase
MFDERFARRTAARYRKRGLSRAARRVVDLVADRGVQDATVLEIGGGVGEIQLELLRRGASSTTNLELSPAYDAEARRLAAEAGLAGKVTRRLVDLAAEPDAVPPADIVVLHRVVCCYPDYERLLGAAAEHAGHLLVFSHPPRTLVSRADVRLGNARQRLGGRDFRAFTHPPEAMLAVLAAHGLHPTAAHHRGVWHVEAVAR